MMPFIGFALKTVLIKIAEARVLGLNIGVANVSMQKQVSNEIHFKIWCTLFYICVLIFSLLHAIFLNLGMIEEFPNEAKRAIISQSQPTFCANCEKLVSSRYKCQGCKLSFIGIAPNHDEKSTKSKGLGAKYWCTICYNRRGKSFPHYSYWKHTYSIYVMTNSISVWST